MKQLWWRVQEPDAPELAPGHRVGEAARALFPRGTLVAPEPWSIPASLEATSAALRADAPVIFETSFAVDGVLAAVDVLERLDLGHALVEVKSTGSVTRQHLADVAFQVFVARASGVELLPTLPAMLTELRAALRGPLPSLAPGPRCRPLVRVPFPREVRRLSTPINLPVARLEPGAPAIDPTQPFVCMPVFTAYPYLVTRMGPAPVRHLILLPGGRTEQDLADLTERQARANQLDTTLCLGPDHALFVGPAGTHARAPDLPWGVPVRRWLLPPEGFAATDEFKRSEEVLARFVDRFPFPTHLIRDPLSDGWLATPDDLERLGERTASARYAGLRRCTACQEIRGEWLALDGEGNGDRRPRVVFVQCSCDNRTCCARCGRPLAPARLSSFRFDETKSGRARRLHARIPVLRAAMPGRAEGLGQRMI